MNYNLPPFPLSEHKSTMFAASLAHSGLRSSVSLYLSALRHLMVETGQPLPASSDWPALRYVTQGIRQTPAASPLPAKRLRLPITVDIMLVLYNQFFVSPSRGHQLSSYDSSLLWAACCTGYFGFMRSGEFTSSQANGGDPVSIGDVSVDSHSDPSIVRLLLRKGKTDPYGNGVFIYLGRTQSVVCPVVALLQFLAIRPSHSGPLFIWQDGSPLTQQQFTHEVKMMLQLAGLCSSSYAGHSFRIGAATTAAHAGLPSHLIKMLGRWESEAYQLFIRTPSETLVQVSSLLAPSYS